MLVLLGELEFELLNPRILINEFGLILILDPGDQRFVLLARLGQLPQILLELIAVGGVEGVDLAPHLPHLRVPGAARERGVARRGRLLVREGDALLVLLMAQPLAQVAAKVAQTAQLGAPDQHLLHPTQRHRLAAQAPHAPHAH